MFEKELEFEIIELLFKRDYLKVKKFVWIGKG